MSSRIRSLLAVTASLTLCLLAFANPVAAQGVHRAHQGGEPQHAERWHGERVRPAANDGPRGMRGLWAPQRASMAARRDAEPGYGLHASGPIALTPSSHDSRRTLTASQLNGSALNTEPMRAGSLRADIARYNAERSGHGGPAQGGMAEPHPPSWYSSNLYTN